jgi:hypothetical protein
MMCSIVWIEIMLKPQHKHRVDETLFVSLDMAPHTKLGPTSWVRFGRRNHPQNGTKCSLVSRSKIIIIIIIIPKGRVYSVAEIENTTVIRGFYGFIVEECIDIIGNFHFLPGPSDST